MSQPVPGPNPRLCCVRPCRPYNENARADISVQYNRGYIDERNRTRLKKRRCCRYFHNAPQCTCCRGPSIDDGRDWKVLNTNTLPPLDPYPVVEFPQRNVPASANVCPPNGAFARFYYPPGTTAGTAGSLSSVPTASANVRAPR